LVAISLVVVVVSLMASRADDAEDRAAAAKRRIDRHLSDLDPPAGR
jgi:hypothetical protein